ncbi:MAG: trans-4-hydroxy-L-proline dehydratase [Lachnospiraceae bacterium]|jgi:pyruvate formate-lyase/glycerol dehydratase family glycyl radical enzyme
MASVEHGMNERIRMLRKISHETQPHIDLERARIETEVYQKYEGSVSVPVLRALVLKEYFSRKTLYFGDGELIVGEKGKDPQSSPTFPELCCHSMQDLEVMNSRELVNFTVTDEDRRIQKEEIIPYWHSRAVREKILSHMTPEWKDCYEAGMFTEFMEQRGPGHTAGGKNFYIKGYGDYKREIQETIDSLDYFNDPEAYDKKEELEAMKIDCDAICILGKRYHDLALEKAQSEENPTRKAELLQIAENCAVVPAHKPETYWQAIQMYWFTHLGVTTELNPWDAFTPGRLDQHLYPFYKKDTEKGILDDSRALELLECLWVKLYNQPAPVKVGVTLKESGTYVDFANINTGGVKADGSDGVNPVSYLILDCMDDMQQVQPNSNVQISKKTPDRFLKRACEIVRKGWGQPAFYNTDELIQELLNAGKSLTDAREGGCSGCVETGAWGNEAYILTGYLNIPKVLQLTLYNGFDPVSGKQIGLKTGNAEDYKTYDELWAAFKKQLEYIIDVKMRGNLVIEKIYAEEMPAPFLSICTNDCIKKGKDYNAGGARYNTSYIQGVGIGTITDSLAALKYNVYDHHKFTMGQMMQALNDNFEGHEDILNLVRNRTPKYGNDDDYADEIMKAVFAEYRDYITGRKNIRGGEYHIDMLPTTCHVYFGDVMLASPNGRLAHRPVSEGISPEKGADTNGPTAVIKSCAKMDHCSTGGTLLNQKFTPAALAGQQGIDNLAALIRSYFAMDGHHIQFNVIDRQTLIDAKKHPEEHKDLIVRVAGYSDYFRNLSSALQDEIIERTEQSFQ